MDEFTFAVVGIMIIIVYNHLTVLKKIYKLQDYTQELDKKTADTILRLVKQIEYLTERSK